MAELPRFSKLPGYDTAPDVYETPEPDLTDSTTVQTSGLSEASSSENSQTSGSGDEEDEEEDAGSSDDGGVVSRRRLGVAKARRRFNERSGIVVEGRGADYIGGGVRGLRVRRDVRGKEDLGERVARLRREVEECRVLAARAGEGEGKEGEDGKDKEEVEGLGEVLRGLVVSAGNTRLGAQKTNGVQTQQQQSGEEEDETTSDAQLLGKIAIFDGRLAALEKTLGLPPSLETGNGTIASPVIPTLNLLDQQVSALLSATSLSNLEAAGTKIRALRREALSTTAPDSPTSPSSTNDDTQPPTLSPTDLTHLQSLYSLLPALQSLSPIVPALLERLRSLRTLHSGAANVAAELDSLERRQGAFEQEMRAWREGLERVEKVVKEADEANGRNAQVVQKWVREVEGRVGGL